MEIILAVRKDLELAVQESLKQKLVRQAGLIGFTCAVPLGNSPALQRQLGTKNDCLIVAQIGEKGSGLSLSWEEVEKLQARRLNLFFLLVGRNDGDCCRAVRRHLHLVGYFNQDEEHLCEKIVETVLWVNRMEIPFCDGIFVREDGSISGFPVQRSAVLKRSRGRITAM